MQAMVDQESRQPVSGGAKPDKQKRKRKHSSTEQAAAGKSQRRAAGSSDVKAGTADATGILSFQPACCWISIRSMILQLYVNTNFTHTKISAHQ